jgi:hypothetical protein
MTNIFNSFFKFCINSYIYIALKIIIWRRKRQLNKQKQYWKRYGEYKLKQIKARNHESR